MPLVDVEISIDGSVLPDDVIAFLREALQVPIDEQQVELGFLVLPDGLGTVARFGDVAYTDLLQRLDNILPGLGRAFNHKNIETHFQSSLKVGVVAPQ